LFLYLLHPFTVSTFLSTFLHSGSTGHKFPLTGLLTGHNTLRRHLHLMWLSSSPVCRRCGAEDETSAHILWVWSFGFTQTCMSWFLLLGSTRHEEFNSWGHLEL